jgi:hypothetical protein
MAVAGATRVVFGRDSVIKNLPEEMKARNHFLDGHFKKVDLKLKFKPHKKNSDDSESEQEEEEMNVKVDKDGCIDIQRVGIFTNELDEFVAHLMLDRVLDPESTLVKIGLDDGQLIFKICMSLQSYISASEENQPKRARYSDVSSLIIP